MNNNRRKRINAIAGQLDAMLEAVEVICEEEVEYLEDMPENLQDSAKYEVAENAIINLQDAIGSIEEAIGYLKESEGCAWQQKNR